MIRLTASSIRPISFTTRSSLALLLSRMSSSVSQNPTASGEEEPVVLTSSKTMPELSLLTDLKVEFFKHRND